MNNSNQNPGNARAKGRIAYVLKVYPRFSQTFVLNEILAHEQASWPLDIVSLRLSDDQRFHEALSRVQSPVFRIRHPAGKSAGFLKQLQDTMAIIPDAARVVAANPDVIASDMEQALALAVLIRRRGIRHLHAHFGTVATTTSRLAAAMAGITYSFTAHAKDIYHETVDPDVLGRKLADAASVVTVSQYNLAYLRERYGDAAGRVVHINNGLPLEEFPFSDPGDRPPRILAVGRLVEKKGFSVLVDACGLLRDRGIEFRCDIAGAGELRGALSRQIRDLGLDARVQLLGPMPQDDIRRLLHESSVLAAPCIVASNDDRDGLPTILLEAMAMGTPCVSTDVTGIPEILDHEQTGLMTPQGDPEALANACLRLLQDPALRKTLAVAARKRIESDFDIQANAAAIRKLVSGVMRANRTE